MGNRQSTDFFKTTLTALFFGITATAWADWELNMPKGVTDLSLEIYDLHMKIFIICCVIGVFVFGAMIWSLVKHRKSVHPTPATFTHSTVAEIAWTTIPIIILIVMAYPAAKVLVKLEDASASDLTIQVTGYQWMWHYEYPEEAVSFYSKLSADANIARRKSSGIDVTTVPNYLRDVDKPMVVPVNKKVRILLTANDVIHAWWVPELGGKKDAVPGFINTMWFKANEIGIYRGQCAELCGRDHGFMPIVVNVVSQADFDSWVAAQPGSTTHNRAQTAPAVAHASTQSTTAMAVGAVDVPVPTVATQSLNVSTTSGASETDKDKLMAMGESVYQKHCSACHQADGKGIPPVFPALTDSAVVKGPVSGHIDNVMNGSPGTAMVAFGATLNDEEIAAVVTYERNALGNSVGDVVSAKDVAALRGK